MKLTQIGTQVDTKSINKILESRFGFTVDFDKLNAVKARKIINKLDESLQDIRKSFGIHTAEQNPRYLELLMVSEGLNKYMQNYKPSNAPKQKKGPAMKKVTLAEAVGAQNYKSMKRAMDIGQAGKPVPAKYMESFAPVLKLVESMVKGKQLNEGQMGEAGVLLAAKDIVDTLQGMIEDLSKLQNEQMPALLDSIRDEIGSAQGDSFNASISQMLSPLLDQLRQAREQADSAARVLSGEQQDNPMAMPGAAPAGGEAPVGDIDPAADLGLGGESDGFDATDAAAGGDEALGREMR